MGSTNANSRIAKNTILLYIRMIILMAVSLYTSRVVLEVLGVEDYGLYNVVGGVVTMFTFLSSAMGNSTQRYITYALGKGKLNELQKTFSTTCLIHWLLAAIVLILSETVGLWFLINKMVIPADRLVAAHWVYQFSILACIVSIVSIPYNALVIAHEKMGTFAFLSLFYAFAKLGIAYIIMFTRYDQLVFYAGLLLAVQLLDRVFYQIYCKKQFCESRNINMRNITQLREMTSFAGWSILPNLATVCYSQGINILLNIFFGPAINAARGISVQVQGVVKNFVSNFQIAVSPQIIKAYASNDKGRLHALVFKSSKMSFYLLLCMALPILIEAEYILGVWLKEVPDHTASFLRLIILAIILDPLANPLSVANNATGNIKKFKIWESSICLSVIPIGYLFLEMGFESEVVFVIQIVLSVIVQIARISLSRKDIDFSYFDYLKNVVFYISLVSLVSPILPLFIYFRLPVGFFSFSLVSVLSVISVCICAYLLGLNMNERHAINSKLSKIMMKLK
ncbi:uncharacterized protein BN523_02212 [Bacteroides sp. CAG:189]|nr:uncharacterized protein BN523_02212 [Bacteroides sp. CAG:189]